MAITYPITLPSSPAVAELAWEHESAVGETTSEFTYNQKVFVWDGQLRRVTAKYPSMTVAQAKQWQAAFMKLNGLEGTFYFKDTPIARALGGLLADGFGTGVIGTGGGAVGNTMGLASLTASLSPALKAGDWLSVGDRLYSVLEDANSNGSGVASVTVWPSITTVIANGTAVKFGSEARGIFRLEGWPEFAYSIERLMKGFTFVAREAI